MWPWPPKKYCAALTRQKGVCPIERARAAVGSPHMVLVVTGHSKTTDVEQVTLQLQFTSTLWLQKNTTIVQLTSNLSPFEPPQNAILCILHYKAGQIVLGMQPKIKYSAPSTKQEDNGPIEPAALKVKQNYTVLINVYLRYHISLGHFRFLIGL